MSNPKHHHYLPKFYLRRWVDSNDKLVRFWKPHDNVIVDEGVSPEGTGFEPHLYQFGDRSLEVEFTKQVDNAAAVALSRLEDEGATCFNDHKVRHDWASYLTLQLLRSPVEVEQLKLSLKEEWEKSAQKIRAKYGTSVQVQEQLRKEESTLLAEVAVNLFAHSKIIDLLKSMYWGQISTPADTPELLTSDKPIWHTATLTEENAFLRIPLGPRLLFLACKDRETFVRIVQFEPKLMSKKLNRITVCHAEKFVFGGNASMLPFVSKYFATKRHTSLFELLAKGRGLSIRSKRSPQYQ